MLTRYNYMRGRVLFEAVREKEHHASFLFEHKDEFPAMAMNILNMIDEDNQWISGYIDLMAYRRRTHPLYDDYKEQLNNHLMLLYLQDRARKLLHAIVVLKRFFKRYATHFIEWFYDPDVGPFMKRKSKSWRLNSE